MFCMDNSQLNWLWKLTTKWYFFPLLVFILVLLYSIFALKSINFESLLISLIIPSSLYGAILLPETGAGDAFLIFPIIFYLSVILISSIILFYKLKKRITLKWLIVILLLFVSIPFLVLIFYAIITGKGPRLIIGPF